MDSGEANYDWWNSKIDARSLGIDPEESLQGQTLISIETVADEQDADIVSYLSDNFANFLKYVRFLPPQWQDLTLSYLLCNKIQRQLAQVFDSTQTQCSYYTRLAVKAMCAYMVWGDDPTPEQLSRILVDAGQECQLLDSEDRKGQVQCSLSSLVTAYKQSRNFGALASKYGVHRPELKRTIRTVALRLQESSQPEHKMVGAWLEMVIYKASPVSGNSGYRQAKKKEATIQRTDPDCVGQFRIRLADYERVKAPTRQL